MAFRPEFEFHSRIAGVSHCNRNGTDRQALIRAHARPGLRLLVRPEPDNPVDPLALALDTPDGHQLGYVRAENGLNKDVCRWLAEDRLITVYISNLTGGTDDKLTCGVNIHFSIYPHHREPAGSPPVVQAPSRSHFWPVSGLICGMLAVVLVGIIGASHGQKPAAADVRPASQKVEAPKLAAVQEKIAEAPKADEITEETKKSADVALIKGDLVAMPNREGWRYIQIEEADGRNYLLTLWYNAPLVTQARAEQDTKDIARVVLKSLMKAGRNPVEMKLRLSVTAKKVVAGETTTKGAVRYGYAVYDFIDDSLVYKQCGKGWLYC